MESLLNKVNNIIAEDLYKNLGMDESDKKNSKIHLDYQFSTKMHNILLSSNDEQDTPESSQKINDYVAAYEVLSNDETKQLYDQLQNVCKQLIGSVEKSRKSPNYYYNLYRPLLIDQKALAHNKELAEHMHSKTYCEMCEYPDCSNLMNMNRLKIRVDRDPIIESDQINFVSPWSNSIIEPDQIYNTSTLPQTTINAFNGLPIISPWRNPESVLIQPKENIRQSINFAVESNIKIPLDHQLPKQEQLCEEQNIDRKEIYKLIQQRKKIDELIKLHDIKTNQDESDNKLNRPHGKKIIDKYGFETQLKQCKKNKFTTPKENKLEDKVLEIEEKEREELFKEIYPSLRKKEKTLHDKVLEKQKEREELFKEIYPSKKEKTLEDKAFEMEKEREELIKETYPLLRKKEIPSEDKEILDDEISDSIEEMYEEYDLQNEFNRLVREKSKMDEILMDNNVPDYIKRDLLEQKLSAISQNITPIEKYRYVRNNYTDDLRN